MKTTVISAFSGSSSFASPFATAFGVRLPDRKGMNPSLDIIVKSKIIGKPIGSCKHDTGILAFQIPKKLKR